ncbi:radical SAM protein [Thalassomonas viridans]|uniref:Radical SAM protein n=1 Tax=Thalassomonas viridans TaxID=137584 RepID=A0AAF0CBN5_9GAMM|nr:radical SAM protein [Thalassomonas viridans]WDE07903.1 radical SAM protein [Thalassomonas viridans]
MTPVKAALTKKLRHLNRRYFPGYMVTPPQWLVLGVNNLCNLHCKMCDVGTENNETIFATNLIGSTPKHMPLALFEKIVLQTASYFPDAKLGYAFTEPLIYKHLEESLALTCKHKLYTCITTNALNLEKKADAISENRVAELFISLDGPREIHNQIRGHSQAFEKAMAGLEKLFSFHTRPKVSVYCVISRWNIGRLTALAEFFRHYPISHLGFMHTNFTPKSVAFEHNLEYGPRYFASHSNIELTEIEAMDLDLLWQELKQLKSRQYPFNVSVSPELENEAALTRFYRAPHEFIGRQCKDVFSNIMIKSDGNAIPAHGRCFNLTLGNLYQDNLKNLWNSAAYARLRRDLRRAGGLFPACARCCSGFAE